MNTTKNSPSHYRSQVARQLYPYWADWLPGFELRSAGQHDGILEGDDIPARNPCSSPWQAAQPRFTNTFSRESWLMF